jgi:hypothetical protein
MVVVRRPPLKQWLVLRRDFITLIGGAIARLA